MDDSGAYQGSMAFNQYLSLQEDVSLNTGSLTLTRPIVSLPGVNSSIGLQIGLTYSIGVQGILGLPANWTFNIPYVIPGATLTANGQTNIIDFSWSDESGYQSGLRYVNNHGILFEAIVPPQPLPSGNSGEYAYRYTYSDGSRDYFDATGKRLEHDDVFGNWLYFTYTDQFAGVYNNYLQSVVDSYGQQVQFSYAPGALIVALPNGQSITLNVSSQGVASVVDELGCTTSFTYGSQAGYNVVTQIVYPTGLCSQVSYTTIPYATSSGTASFPAVSSLLRLDGGTTFLNQTNYTYGLNTNGNTYTGYSAGYLLGTSGDGLMDSNNTGYVYDTTVSVVDDQSRLLAYSEHYFNYLHALVTKSDFLVDNTGAAQPCLQVANTYAIDADWHARSTNYNKPSNTVSMVWSASDNEYLPTQQSTFTYDAYGNPLTAAVAMYDAPSQAYVPQTVSTFTYVVANWGGEMPQSATVADAVTGNTRISTYALTADQKSIASTVQAYQTSAGGEIQPWKTSTYTYDAQGRRLSEQTAWSAGAPNPNPQLASATTTYAYSYDLPLSTLTTTKTDALGNVAINKTLTNYPGGILVQATNPLGQVSTFAYDAIGRLTSTTDPLGYVTTLSYACLQQDDCNRVRTVTQTGYTTDAFCDGLGRQTKIMDNGGSSPSNVNRQLSLTVFNAMGKPASSTGILGLTTTFEYDALGRLVATTDPHNNTTATTYSDMQRMAVTTLNGITQSQQVVDNLNRPVTQTRYPNPADTTLNYCVNQLTAFDGFGQAVSTTLQQVPTSGGQATTLSVLTKTYDAEGQVASESFTGYQSQSATASKTFQRDLFGNAVSYSKQVSYADGRNYQWQSEVYAYDACNNLLTKTNQLGQTESYTYYANGRLAGYKRYDGTIINYAYDANSNLASLQSGSAEYTYSYFADNKLQSVSQGGNTISYQYFLDGGLQKTTYPDGTSQTLSIDQYSRIVGVSDFAGTTTTLQYTATGQLASKRYGDQQLVSNYGVVNAVNDVLVGATLSGSTTLNYSYGYDGFGRMVTSNAVQAGQSAPLLATVYSYDAQDRTIGLQTTSGSTVTTTSYTFDGLNQVVTQASGANTAAFTYDGNTNVISQVINGAAQSFTYNSIDQTQGQGIVFDANGRLTADGSGTTYAYDAFDKLCSATSSAGAVSYAYYPDGMLSTRQAQAGSSTFYYSDGTASQVRSSASGADSWQTYLFHGDARLASIDAEGDAAYLLVANKSTAAVYDDAVLSPMEYQAYGAQAGQQPASSPSFSWKQEYVDPDNKLVYLRSRFYHPSLMRFMSMDSYAVSNRYAFGDGNPIDNIDPTGHMSQGAAMGIGIGVGIVATLLTGGALGVVVGTDIAASMAVGAVAGAVGSVAGDGTTAALSGQKFTAERALVDIGAGFAGGLVGAGVGGAVGRGAMACALEQGLSRGAVTAIGAVSAGLTGGIAGGAAASGVTSAAYGQPFFSSATALNMVMGGVAGLGGGILGSAAHLGMLGSAGGSAVDIMPVEADPANSAFNTATFRAANGTRVVDFSPSDGDDLRPPILRAGNRDAVVVHGFARHVFPETAIGGQLYTQYMTPEAFADLLRNNYGIGGRDINLWSCFAAKLRLASVAQRIATRLNVNVYAPACRDSVTLGYTGAWIRYTP